MEVWVISTQGELAYVNNMMQGSEAAAFEDTDAAATKLGAGLFEVLVMGREHTVLSRYNSFVDLAGDHHRSEIDTAVRSAV